MENSNGETSQDTALALGIALGLIACIVFIAISRTEKGRAARARVGSQASRVDMRGISARIPAAAQESAAKGRNALAAGRERASGLMNRSGTAPGTAEAVASELE